VTDHQPPYPGQTPPPFPGQTPPGAPPFAGGDATQAGQQAPGWYPDPTQAGNQREWDGHQWVGPSVPMGGAAGAAGGKKGGFPKWLIPVIACLALAFVAVIGGAIAGSGDSDKDKEEVSSEEETTTTEAEEETTTTTEEPTTTTEEPTTTTTEAPTTTTTAPSVEAQAAAWVAANGHIFDTLSGDLDNIATASQAQDVAALNVACTGLQTNVGTALGLDPIPLPETERLWRDALGEFQAAADLCIQGTAGGLDPQKIVDAAGHISAGTDLLNQAAATIPGS
jgi:hypothetical protein